MNETTSKSHRCEAISGIINSVAEEQSGLASILEVEAEKIKLIASLSKDTKEILEANKSVEKMINAITKLEVILASKLELFSDCLCVDCDGDTTGGYSIVSMTVETENGGRVERDDDLKTFRYYPGSGETSIKFISDPDTVITYISGMPTGLKYDNNILYIPANYAWPQTYTMKFTVGEGEKSYEIILMNII